MSLEAQLLSLCRRRIAAGARPVLGLNGPVGAGKTSLARRLQGQFAAAGIRLAVASIDDAYLPWDERLQRLAGNPFGVTRVPPGSHDPALLVQALDGWRADRDGRLSLPRFDKTLRAGEGDRTDPWCGAADALLLEGWLVGCRPVDALEPSAPSVSVPGPGDRQGLGAGMHDRSQGQHGIHELQPAWIRRCDAALADYRPLWDRLDGLVMLWPIDWSLPRRWRFQAEARQRRQGGGWMNGQALNALVDASLKSLPQEHYQQPLLNGALWVRVLDRQRRCLWEGCGAEALDSLAQLSSPSSSATG